jgi:hypothetical protein
MGELYRVTPPNQKPEVYRSLFGAAETWKEFGCKGVVEQVTETGEIVREVPFLELRRIVDRNRGQTSE